jgi:succinate-semialdehyde dehydrogenase / glutarate-semialdehyde dehydrogenase
MKQENGGNAPFIVFEDADMELALDALMAAKFRNSGQTCISANRIFVHDSIYDTFAKKLVERVETRLKVGDGMISNISCGPLINEAAVKKVSPCVTTHVLIYTI